LGNGLGDLHIRRPYPTQFCTRPPSPFRATARQPTLPLACQAEAPATRERRLVRAEGLEPPRLASLEPKSSASTSSATPAFLAIPRQTGSPREGRPYNRGFQGWLGVWPRSDRRPPRPDSRRKKDKKTASGRPEAVQNTESRRGYFRICVTAVPSTVAAGA